MATVKIGILGCADIVQKYAMNAFQALENAHVIAIASRDPHKAKEWASRYHIEAADSYDALLTDKRIDAVYIPLPVGLHKEWALKAAAAGKHVLCEKSLAESFSAVSQIVEAFRVRDLVLFENFMCDFHPQHEKILSLIRSGNIGQPFIFQSMFGFPHLAKENIRYDKSLGGGVLNDIGAYPVFMARKILGKEPLAVTCRLSYEDSFNVDTKGNALLEFSDNQTALISFGYGLAYQNSYIVWGETGSIRTERAYSISPDTVPPIMFTKTVDHADTVTPIVVSAANQFEIAFRTFCDAVLHSQGKRPSWYDQIIAQAKVLEALRISAQEGTRVLIK